ncbi:MAG: type I methionyl aminopeptidase [Terriglobia bacterium]|jgi:methionyl aminopeptidase
MIICRSPAEIEKLRNSARLGRQILYEVRDRARAGVSTLELDSYVEKRLAQAGAKPAFKGYRGYPRCLCTSINEQIMHGIPSGRRLKDGDILGLDFGLILNGYYGDTALTIPIGEIPEAAQRLLRVSEEALELGIAQARHGNRVGDISATIQKHVEKNGYSVVREFVGHGIGRALHEEPQIPNYGDPGHGPLLKAGMVLAIETMVNEGRPELRILNDNWTAVAADGKNTAHFEHMVAVTRNGPDVLTRI